MSEANLIYKDRLKSIIKDFKASKDMELERQERKIKENFINNYLNEEHLDQFDEGALRELIQLLWSFYGWTNKDYLVDEMLRSGIENIREALKFLINNNKPVAKRFDYVKSNIRMMGAAAISEILTHFDDSCAIWNRRAREGLVYLGVPDDKIPSSPQINGKKYEEYCALAKEVLDEVYKYNQEIQNFLDLNSLLFYISNLEYKEMPSDDESEEQADEDFEHDYAIEQITQLGDGLGFEVESEFNVAPGCRIDALWRSRIANLGIISYAFEVHRRGSRDSAILNLQRVIKQDTSIQKVIIVSNEKEIEAFKKEISSLGEEFREAIGYLEVNELEKALGHLDSLKEVLNYAGLMKP